jgi:hypothetical protein
MDPIRFFAVLLGKYFPTASIPEQNLSISTSKAEHPALLLWHESCSKASVKDENKEQYCTNKEYVLFVASFRQRMERATGTY